MTPEMCELAAKVARTRAAQGLPPTIQDPAALERAAAVLRLMTPAEPVVPSRRRRSDRQPAA
jgi:hypothetical protein